MKVIDEFLARNAYPQFDLKAVFFDMDGVLFNSMPFHARAWAETLRARGFDFSEYDAYMNEGRTGESTIHACYQKAFHRNATPDEVHEIYDEKARRFLACGAVGAIDGVLDVLRFVKSQHLDIYIVTGSAQTTLFDTLNEFFPNIFNREKMVTAFDVRIGKPNPEPYLMALKKANVAPWQAVVVENAPLGVQSAVDAGIFTIAVNTGILRPEELEKAGANLVLPNMHALLQQMNDICSASKG